MATESAEATGDVEALALMVSDVASVVFKFERQYMFEDNHLKKILGYLQLGVVGTTTCRTFSAKEVEEATNNYHVSRIIGN